MAVWIKANKHGGNYEQQTCSILFCVRHDRKDCRDAGIGNRRGHLEIEPKAPYTEADLDWMDKKARSTIEMNDAASRPEIAVKRDNMKRYDTILVGFPIWRHVAPMIINTFLESYDLTDKTFVPFATSGCGDMGKTNERLAPSCKGVKLLEGRIFKENTGHKELAAWVDGLEL